MTDQPFVRVALMVGLIATVVPSVGRPADPPRSRPSFSARPAPARLATGAKGADLQCLPDQDVSCTLVRETPNGVLVWTERYRPAPSSAHWSLVLDTGTLILGDPVAFVPDPTSSTPNGAPILE
jgi:hypothetical protein